ncbi:MAG TPA: hypothetical protein VGH38_22220 [Bryobacteraceae bacterium]
MHKPIADLDAIRTITVLSISRFEEDHLILERILQGSAATLYPNCRLRVIRCSEPAGAVSMLRGAAIPIVLCDADDPARGWLEMARDVQGVSEPPCLILASKVADDRLCVEAGKGGAYDVLAKPFHGPEVLRVIARAWRHWQGRYGLAAAAPETRRVPSGT